MAFPRYALAGALLAVLACALNAVGLFDHALWLPDEPREAEIAREYADREDWVVPWLNGGRWLEKPPLYHWTAAALFRWTGSRNPGVARIPSALSGAVIGACAWILARRMGPAGTGPWAGFLAWTSAELLNAAHCATVDAMFSAFVTAALTCFVLGGLALRPGAWDILAAFCAGLAFLTKFHLGPLLVAGAILAWAALHGNRGMPKRLFSPLPLLVFLATVAPWPALLYHHQHRIDLFHGEVARLLGRQDPGLAEGRNSLEEILWGQMLRRSTGGHYGHAQPPWYYLPALLTFAAPCSLALLAALPWGWKRRKEPLAGFALAWLLAALLILSLPRAKRLIYLAPCVAPAALLVSAWGKEALDRWEDRGGLQAVVAGLAGLLALSSAAFPWIARSIAGPLPGAEPWALPLALLALGGLALSVRGRPRDAGIALAGWLVLGILAADIVLVPAIDKRESFAPLARELRRRAATPGPRSIEGYCLSENLQGAVAFALGQRIRTTTDPREALERLRLGNLVLLTPLDRYRELERDPEVAALVNPALEFEAAGIRFAIIPSSRTVP